VATLRGGSKAFENDESVETSAKINISTYQPRGRSKNKRF
ncbi:hypothetical protein V3C99_008706, partial [Haemonchus contortus]|uniref:Transposase n=1 Tax=Haemonchus contortus TaxID=6289 RepID=A0A7I5EAT5_HAECO